MPVARSADGAVDYRVTGSGPALVLVHGVGGDAEATWGAVTPALSERRTVIAPNLAGTTATPSDDHAIAVQGLAAQVIAVLADAEVETFDLAGYSLGGAVAALVAAEAGDRARTLTVVAGWARSDARARLMFDLWQRLFANDPGLFVRLAVLTGFSPRFLAEADDATLDQVVAGFTGILAPGTAQQAAAAATVDVTDRLGDITASTRVFGLLHDQHVPVASVRELADGISGARYAELDSGHLLPWEDSDALRALLEDGG